MIAIVIPTLDRARAEATGKLALLNAGIEARVIVSDGEPRGFTKTANDGIRQTAPDEDVCILNDDISGFQYGWLKALSAGLYSATRFGIAGPSGKSGTAPACTGTRGMIGLQQCRQLAFWCVLIRRQVLTEIGLLDERFIHYCSDNEYCARAAKHNWHCVWVRGVYLEHRHHGSGLKMAWRDHDQAEFRRKRSGK